MAYKARRTRDLQGEVQAGTNVSVSETTKPDGTKVYTLSADSGEIPTLSDMANSAATFDCSLDYYSGYLFQYSAYMIIEDIPINSFFEENETLLNFDGSAFVGVLVKKQGIYRYEQRIEIIVETSAAISDNTFHCNIIAVDENGNYDTLMSYNGIFLEYETNKYYGVIDIATTININENLTVGIIANFDDTNVIQSASFGDNPILSIQKIR